MTNFKTQKQIFFVTCILFMIFSFSRTNAAEECLKTGQLKIPDVSINVDLYYFNNTDMVYAQQYTDDIEKAVYIDNSEFFKRVVTPLIGDHRNQGFDGLYSVIENSTVAKIEYTDGSITQYICREVDRQGINDGEFIKTSNGDLVDLLYPSNWIVMYTCNPEGWQSVTVTFWEPQQEFDNKTLEQN